MAETQKTIGAWVDATFPGSDPTQPRKELRALDETVELCLAGGATAGEIREKVERALRKAFDGSPTAEAVKPNPGAVPAEAADVAIVLNGLAELKGFDLQEEVDKKMAINRARRWGTNGDGTGYHIDPEK